MPMDSFLPGLEQERRLIEIKKRNAMVQ